MGYQGDRGLMGSQGHLVETLMLDLADFGLQAARSAPLGRKDQQGPLDPMDHPEDQDREDRQPNVDVEVMVPPEFLDHLV